MKFIKVLLASLLFSTTALAQFNGFPPTTILRIKNSGTIVTPTRPFLNFTGAAVTCADDPTNVSTTCTIGGGAEHVG